MTPRAQQTSPDWPTRFADLAYQTHSDRLRAFYEAGVVSGQTPIRDAPLVALDFETTGLDPRRHGILSIGLVPFSLQRIYCGQARHWLVNPKRPLEEESVTIHGITHSALDDAPDIVEVLSQVLDCLAGKLVVVHYRAIERGFFDAALRVRLNEGIEFPVIDTMHLEVLRHRTGRGRWLAWLKGGRQTSIRLADSRTRYGLPHYPPHHATVDALATAELLQAQVAHHYHPDTPVGELWV